MREALVQLCCLHMVAIGFMQIPKCTVLGENFTTFALWTSVLDVLKQIAPTIASVLEKEDQKSITESSESLAVFEDGTKVRFQSVSDFKPKRTALIKKLLTFENLEGQIFDHFRALEGTGSIMHHGVHHGCFQGVSAESVQKGLTDIRAADGFEDASGNVSLTLDVFADLLKLKHKIKGQKDIKKHVGEKRLGSKEFCEILGAAWVQEGPGYYAFSKKSSAAPAVVPDSPSDDTKTAPRAADKPEQAPSIPGLGAASALTRQGSKKPMGEFAGATSNLEGADGKGAPMHSLLLPKQIGDSAAALPIGPVLAPGAGRNSEQPPWCLSRVSRKPDGDGSRAAAATTAPPPQDDGPSVTNPRGPAPSESLEAKRVAGFLEAGFEQTVANAMAALTNGYHNDAKKYLEMKKAFTLEAVHSVELPPQSTGKGRATKAIRDLKQALGILRESEDKRKTCDAAGKEPDPIEPKKARGCPPGWTRDSGLGYAAFRARSNVLNSGGLAAAAAGPPRKAPKAHKKRGAEGTSTERVAKAAKSNVVDKDDTDDELDDLSDDELDKILMCEQCDKEGPTVRDAGLEKVPTGPYHCYDCRTQGKDLEDEREGIPKCVRQLLSEHGPLPKRTLVDLAESCGHNKSAIQTTLMRKAGLVTNCQGYYSQGNLDHPEDLSGVVGRKFWTCNSNGEFNLIK
tara:strand:- start:20687 stop:22735 length:2049 start_codon:yes stop_codon:yes gene_type:complete